MTYNTRVALLIPQDRFPKFYNGGFEYKNPVAVERAPFIHSEKDKSTPFSTSGRQCSQVSYLRWMGSLKNVSEQDREHINEVADLYSNLPFDISCRRCGDNKAEKIALPFQFTYGYGIDASYPELGFPFFCESCGDSSGSKVLKFALNFDSPFNPFGKRNYQLAPGTRQKLLRDLKRMVHFGFENGPSEFLDTRRIMTRISEMEATGENVSIRMNNRDAKRIANHMHFLKERKINRVARQSSPQMGLFEKEPDAPVENDYRERYIYTLDRTSDQAVA